MDLSKPFGTLNHDLLIAKLHAYGFGKESSVLLLRGYTKVCNHPQLLTIHNHPKKPPTNTQNHPQPPKSYPKKPKLVTNMLLHFRC